ncbi:siderophore-interacting protein [Yinghuangia sp. ASG 101]|uniref:siderophore-interacting protein n=1 Tax=Yinghuangia sp. ASG 101 TaxID=2896848 RepID=UPI001E47F263|nr:siderophore-interacting protein [Yinghuangia sp. ASG 101]UGQ12907.1 siderophore-interacting protein [Yinghuangia sp. ASG 101]
MTTSDSPFRFFDLHVVRAERIGPGFVRVTFGGEDLASFVTDGRDQRLKLFFPHAGQDAPVVPVDAGDDWFTTWSAMDAHERGIMRTYTARDVRRDPDELDVDFAVHGDSGPASRWAGNAAPGQRLVAMGPRRTDNGGADFAPPRDAPWVLVAADESALPAVEGILRWLPEGPPAHVWISVAHDADRRELPARAGTNVRWFTRNGSGDPIPGAIAEADLPEGTPYAWIAGESSMVRAVRRNLVRDRGYDRKSVSFTGYWRRGATDDDLLVESLAGQEPYLPGKDD